MTDPLKKTNTGLKRRPFLTPIWLAVLSAAIVVSFATWLWSTADSTTVVVVRAAEIEEGAADAALSGADQARSEALSRMLGDPSPVGRVGFIYCVSGTAARATVAALAQRIGVVPVDVPADDEAGLARRALREHPGARMLIVATPAGIPKIVASLGGQGATAAAADSNTMVIVTVPRIGRANVLRLNY